MLKSRHWSRIPVVGLAFVILIIALVIAAAIGIGSYGFFYLQPINEKPLFANVVAAEVRIVEGASNENNPMFMDPKVAIVILGVNNTVRWINEDSTPHVIAADTGYIDPLTGGLFDSRERPSDEGGPFVMPGETYEFTFSKVGQYDYHHEPHPWVTGSIIVRAQ